MSNADEKTALKTHGDVLDALVDEVSLSAAVLEKIQSRYQAISAHLDRDDSTIKPFDPYVYPQGSVNLGTANRPLDGDDEIDVDIVAELRRGSKDWLTQALLKEKVAFEVRGYAEQNQMSPPEDGKRCLTLNYRDHQNGGHKFHVDILPAIPDQDGYRAILEASAQAFNDSDVDGAIAITCKEHKNFHLKSNDWPVSNPKGYAAWFESRQAVILTEMRDSLVRKGVCASVDDIPLFRVSTPLQKVIKLLKRDRDTTMGDDEHKPISIIITTLAAQAYQGEDDLVAAVNNILSNMEEHIHRDEAGDYYIPNPTNPAENFADRWLNEPVKAGRFFEWLNAAKATYTAFLSENIRQSRTILAKSLSDSAFDNISEQLPTGPAPTTSLLLETMKAEAASGSVDTDKLLRLIQEGIDHQVSWPSIEKMVRTNFDLSVGTVFEDVAKINFYQVARHQGLQLSPDAISDIESIVSNNAGDASFRMCASLLLGTATKGMVDNCIASRSDRADVLRWPIIKLAPREWSLT